MRLHALLRNALGVNIAGPDIEVVDVVQRHDQVRPGSLFVARRGARFDAHDYLEQAVAAGAVAVVGEADLPALLPWNDVPYLQVADARVVLPELAAVLNGRPAQSLEVLGVTGTDGKTTTSFLLQHLLDGAAPTGLISTAGVRIGAEAFTLPQHFTTPEATEVQSLLARCRAAGLARVVLETSSHGFSLHRLDAIPFRLGVWTNLSPEHLDHHGSYEAYREAKLTLVRRAEVAVLNRDEPDYAAFAAAAKKVVSYGQHRDSHVRLEEIQEAAGAMRIGFVVGGRPATAQLPMIGRYNAWNAAAALAAATELGLPLDDATARLAGFTGVPGRMQVIQAQPFTVVVDFAHTAPALAKALQAARPAVPGRLIVVVGAAGERDPGKRAPLGEAAQRHADLAFFTEEDSRSEALADILASMEAGAIATGGVAGKDFMRVADRRDAIRDAIGAARPGDVVLLAGKGPESTLERAHETLPWNEVAEARRWLKRR